MTVQTAFQLCLDKHWSNPRFQRSGWAKEVERLFERRIQGLLGWCELTELRPVLLRAWHASITEISSTEANRALEVISKIFSFAAQQEVIPPINPCKLVTPNPEAERSRYATPDEIRRLGKVLGEHWDYHPRDTAFIFLLLLTGSRPRTLMRAKRSDIQGKMLSLDGKATATTGQKDVIALPEFVVNDVLARIPLRPDGLLIGEPFPHVFWSQVRGKAGCPDLWARDLRRTFATVGLSQGIPLDVIGELLNHRTTQTTLRYAKLLPDVRLKAANDISETILALLEKTPVTQGG